MKLIVANIHVLIIANIHVHVTTIIEYCVVKYEKVEIMLFCNVLKVNAV